jgi:3-methyl-2-oxobutanoate hydroxymethyltransferase
MLGLFDWTPRFVKRYADLKTAMEEGVQGYAQDVRERRFPGPNEVYAPKKG